MRAARIDDVTESSNREPEAQDAMRELTEDAMTPLRGSRKFAAMRAIGWRADASPWGVDTAFSRPCGVVPKRMAPIDEPARGMRPGTFPLPDPFRSDHEILIPLIEGFADAGEAAGACERPGGADVAVFVHRGPYARISGTYEKVLDWLRENRYEVAGAPREFFVVAPDPHAGGTGDDMLTEIEVPIRKAS